MKIALIGYGKMGRMIEQIAIARGHEIVCRIDVDNQECFESSEFSSADVAIEFTNPASAYDNYLKAFKHNVKVVSGSTGWMHEHRADVEKLCNEGGQTLFWASNFSIGMAIFSRINKRLAEIMNRFPQYAVELEETHHIHKLDAPSGTAITLAEDIIAHLDRKDKWIKSQDKATENELPISSIRQGEVPGTHTISYNSEADKITITHEAFNREGFALGAVLAAEYTQTHKGLLTINDMFDFSKEQ